ncbi:3-phosphoinositide-dependent protein kinase 1 [Lamellibrachia satsuma]|nr:3-phosphoinositide-dependent protein kinase 1 [Lamellibrachia satsuma]
MDKVNGVVMKETDTKQKATPVVSPNSMMGGGDQATPPTTPTQTPSQTAEAPTQPPMPNKKPEDFRFGKMIGEGSYSTVFLAREESTGKKYASKSSRKAHIIREKKEKYVKREKEVLQRINHPFFIKLYFTFQDKSRLYFGLSYAPRGELLDYIHKLDCFDENCTRFYTAETVVALEYLHRLGIIHRDLKPENILLSEDMHIQITDFGSAKIVDQGEEESSAEPQEQRRRSFVGTAQYVSPEILTSKRAYFSSDLWALGCIVYQLLSGQLPFWGGHEYQIFQKITKLEYEFPDGFSKVAKDLVEKLLVLDPTNRLGCKEMKGYGPLKAHPFFTDTDWEHLHEIKPPELLPYLPAKGSDAENLWSHFKPGLDDQLLTKLIGVDFGKESGAKQPDTQQKTLWLSNEEQRRKLETQRSENEYHRFVDSHLVLKQGLIDKRKGLFARRRMFLLTEGPHLYYVDPSAMVLKGEIPWSKELRTEVKNFKIFFVHTPNRTYYLEDPEGNAIKWCKKIDEVWSHYYSNSS